MVLELIHCRFPPYSAACAVLVDWIACHTLSGVAGICMSVESAAKKLIKGGNADEGLLNMVEMAFRAYDPCLSCATHALPGEMPLCVELIGPDGDVLRTIERS